MRALRSAAVFGLGTLRGAFVTLNIIHSRSRYWLLAAGAAAFGLSVAGSFHFDDYSMLTGNPLRTLSTRPLTALSFLFDRAVAGQNPVFYHGVNLALHLAAVWLLFEALSRLLPERAAVVATLVFAIHPIQAEAVNYVFARSTLLDTVLCLAALLLWVQGRYWWAVLAFAAALLAKEECVSFPVFLMLLTWSLRSNGRPKPAPPLAAMFGVALAAGAWVYLEVLRTPGTQAGPGAGISAGSYLLTQGFVILRYLCLLIVPVGLNVDSDIPRMVLWQGIVCWLVVAGLIAVAWRWRAGFWFAAGLILLLPSSSIFPAADLSADRRMYLPMVAFAACAGLLLARVRRPWIAGLAVLLIGLSVQRTLVWRTEQTLWTDAVAKSPRKVRTVLQLARAVEPREALDLIRRARELAPNDPRVPTEAGRVYMELGRPAPALSEFGRALALTPNDPAALNNRGAALLALGQKEAARADFERALKSDPCLRDARENLKGLGVDLPACGK